MVLDAAAALFLYCHAATRDDIGARYLELIALPFHDELVGEHDASVRRELLRGADAT